MHLRQLCCDDSMKDVNLIADQIGVFASSACALHCLLVPVLLVAGVALPASFLDEEVMHQALLFLVLPAALVAFGIGCWRHKDLWVLSLGIVGIVGISAAALLHENLGELIERILTLTAASALITAHIRNYRLCRSGNCNEE